MDRSERPRNRQVVAAADQHPGVIPEVREEARHERGLADPGLTDDDDQLTVAPRRRPARLRERRQRRFPLEELHGSTIDRPSHFTTVGSAWFVDAVAPELLGGI